MKCLIKGTHLFLVAASILCAAVALKPDTSFAALETKQDDQPPASDDDKFAESILPSNTFFLGMTWFQVKTVIARSYKTWTAKESDAKINPQANDKGRKVPPTRFNNLITLKRPVDAATGIMEEYRLSFTSPLSSNLLFDIKRTVTYPKTVRQSYVDWELALQRHWGDEYYLSRWNKSGMMRAMFFYEDDRNSDTRTNQKCGRALDKIDNLLAASATEINKLAVEFELDKCVYLAEGYALPAEDELATIRKRKRPTHISRSQVNYFDLDAYFRDLSLRVQYKEDAATH